MLFEWDEGNRDKNWRKHQVTDQEAEECFDHFYVEFDEKIKVVTERRWGILGETSNGKRLALVYTKRSEKIRVISARPMSRKERGLYERYKKEAEAKLQIRG